LAFLAAATWLDGERRALYGDLVLCSMSEAARRTLEATMKDGYEFQSELARSYVAKGEAPAVLAFLEACGLEVPAEAWERILASADLAELDRWIHRSAVIRDAKEFLAADRS
jgi:hypothetical protein